MSRLPARIHPSALLMCVALLSLPGARATAQTSWFPVTWSNPPEAPVPGVQHRTFRSAALDAEVGYNILLPPDYESSDRRYPVLYWLHGAGGNENVSVPHLTPVVREAVAALQARDQGTGRAGGDRRRCGAISRSFDGRRTRC